MAEPSLSEFLDALAAKNPTPAGGSAAAYAGAMAAALVAMVARTTVGKKGYDSAQEMMLLIEELAGLMRERLEQGVERDSAVFEAMRTARRLPAGEKREAAIRKTSLAGARVPVSIAQDALKVMRLALDLVRNGNRNAVHDALSAILLTQTAITISCMNARANLQQAGPPASVVKLLRQIEDVEAAVQALMQQVVALRPGLDGQKP